MITQNFDLLHYFTINGLFEESILKNWCERHLVNYITSERFPGLVLLKYSDDCVYENQWSDFSMAARGTVVDIVNKKLIAVPYFKFFNLGQMPETNYEILRDKKEFEVSEKLDGSCGVSFFNPNDNQFYLTTTGSFDSEHGKVGTELFRQMLCCHKIAAYAAMGTFIFELIDPRFRIVIDYKKKGYEPGLYLIGYRTQEGRLLTYSEVADLGTQLVIPGPKVHQFESLYQLTKIMKDLPMDQEGFVLRYPDGLMVKIKGEEYLRAHRFVSQLSDKNILQALIEGVDKQMVEVCPDEFRPEILEKVAYFKSRKVDLWNQCFAYFSAAPKDQDRKTFALWVNQNVKPSLKGCMFQLLDCKPLRDKELYGIIEKTEKPSVETKI